METHGETVYRLALCRLQSVPDAEDVYQDVFLRLLNQNTDGWDSAHLKAWLIRTALNRCHDAARFRLRRPVLSLDTIGELAAEAEEGWPELWEAVSRLPEKLRTVVHLFYAEGYHTEEIASLPHCPDATVRSRLHRARRQLKDLLGGVDHETEYVSKPDGAYPRA